MSGNLNIPTAEDARQAMSRALDVNEVFFAIANQAMAEASKGKGQMTITLEDNGIRETVLHELRGAGYKVDPHPAPNTYWLIWQKGE